MITERKKCDGALWRGATSSRSPYSYLLVYTQHVQGHRLPFPPNPTTTSWKIQHCLDREIQTLNAYQTQIENVHERSSMSTLKQPLPSSITVTGNDRPMVAMFSDLQGNKTKQKYGFLCEIFQGKSTKWHPAINQYIEWTSNTTVKSVDNTSLTQL